MGFAPNFVNYKKGCTWLAVASDKAYQLLAHGRWFSPGTPVSSTTKTSRHDIAQILLKVALSTIKSVKSMNVLIVIYYLRVFFYIYVKLQSYLNLQYPDKHQNCKIKYL